MRKLAGSGLVLLGGAVLWCLRMAERRRERETLREVILALGRMREEIRMARTPLPLLLERLAADCRTGAGEFFCLWAASLRGGGARKLTEEDVPLKGAAGRCLLELQKTAKGDEESICKVIALAVMELEKERSSLEERRQDEEKQLTAVCFSASALLVILLI